MGSQHFGSSESWWFLNEESQGWPMLVMFCISQIASDKWISLDINMCVHAKIQDHGWFKQQKCSSAFPWLFPNIQQTHPTEFNGFPGLELCYKAPPGTWRVRRVLAPLELPLEASPLDWANRYQPNCCGKRNGIVSHQIIQSWFNKHCGWSSLLAETIIGECHYDNVIDG